MKIGIIILAMILLCSVPVLSEDVYKQYDKAVLSVDCINNATVCTASATCNISVLYANGSVYLSSRAMTNSGTYFTYTLTDTSVTGVYTEKVFCADGSFHGYGTDTFRITSDGNSGDSTFLFMGFAILGFLVMVLGIWTQNRILLFISGLMISVSGVYVLINGFMDANTEWTKMMSYVVIGIGLIFTVVSAYELIEEWSDESGGEGGGIVEVEDD